MNRRALLQGTASATFLALLPRGASAKTPAIPWGKLRRAVDGNLIALKSPFAQCSALGSTACDALFTKMKNPYFVGDDPALTQSAGWANAWTSATSPYAVAARHAGDIAATVDFAREHDLRLVVKGGGHSYQGTSNAADSLLVWTRHMNDIHVGSDSVKLGSGCIWAHAYDAVTTRNGRYVQGGGCTTVGVAGLVQSGGFGSFSKRYGTAASNLLEAEIVTADGKIRTVNASSDPELHWALKGGGGGTFGIVSSVTLALHPLQPYAGVAVARIKASSDRSYRELVRRFIDFYRESLFNEHWGESVHFSRGNVLSINLVASGLSSEHIQILWKPFFDAIKASPSDYSFEQEPILAAMPAQHWWDRDFWQTNVPTAISLDSRAGHPENWWWAGDSDQVGIFWYCYQSLWLPAALLEDASRAELSDAIFRASRQFGFALHFNKGLAGAPSGVIQAARNTATNPNVTTAFALVIGADGDQGLYPGIAGHEPDLSKAHERAASLEACMSELRAVAPDGGAYVSESNYFERDFGHAYWGSNYQRLIAAKKTYDPNNLFVVHNGVRA